MAEDVAFVAIGDGKEEMNAAHAMGWPFFPVALDEEGPSIPAITPDALLHKLNISSDASSHGDYHPSNPPPGSSAFSSPNSVTDKETWGMGHKAVALVVVVTVAVKIAMEEAEAIEIAVVVALALPSST
eukprot:TRINITY_DN3023_c0_g1_i4.p2 TRINITY_DN3023_c0_g1~~TRINITY_DN3023_c0_g1_i4.p2  ORF type:complete len:129 (-),score=15.23 TRINITY_DN3023_c0_g1_i4:59-445(-)